MPANTATYKFNIPVVGGDENNWGTALNENWNKTEALLQGASYTDSDSNTVERIKPDLEDGQWAINGAAVTASAAELNITDGLTATTIELNKLDGVTATTAELNKLAGCTSSTTELNKLTGLTASTSELNKLDGFTGTFADLNYAKDLNATGVTTTEFDILDGITASTAEINKLAGCTSSTTELNKLTGLTSSTNELNKLAGYTGSTSDLNKLHGLTSTQAELNKLDGFTGTFADLNYAKDLNATGVTTTQFDVLDGITATTAELNYTSGVTSAIQTQIDGLTTGSAAKLPLAGGTMTGSINMGSGNQIFTDTITEVTSSNGVVIDSVLLKDDTVTADSHFVSGGSGSHWEIVKDGTSIIFKYGTTKVMKLSSTGDLQVAGSIESNATIA